MSALGIEAFTAATQTYPRKQDWFIVNALAGLGASVHKFAFDLRILQSPPFGEWSEPFGKHQVGSSAMPFSATPSLPKTWTASAAPSLRCPAPPGTTPRSACSNAPSTILPTGVSSSPKPSW
ncbi:MAG: hypothetical protein R2856_07410 [Caldilineaceae bacterium]